MKFQGRGKAYLAERNTTTGAPGKFFFVGCADALSVANNVETLQHFEKCSGQDLLDYQADRQISSEVTMTLTEWNKRNLLIAARGIEVPDQTSGSVTNEACGTGFVAGDVYFLGQATGEMHTNVSAVTISDTGGALVLGTDYTVDLVTGRVEFLQPTTGAVDADYTFDDLPYVSLLTAGRKEYFMRFDGMNKADGLDKFYVELYRIQFNPSSFDFLSDELAPLELAGAVMVDDSKPSAGELGQFGRMSILQTAP